MGKGYLLDQLRANRSDLKTMKKKVKDQAKLVTETTLVQESETVITSITDLIKETRKLESEHSNVVERIIDFFLDKGAEKAVDMVVDVVGDFVDRYLNQRIEKELLSVSFEPPRIHWGIISAGVSFGFGLSVGLEGERKSDAVEIKGDLKGNAYTQVDLGVGVKLTVPIVNIDIADAMVRGGLRGDLICTAKATLALRAAGTDLKGGLDRTIIDTDFKLTAFLLIPETIRDTWDIAVNLSFGSLDSLPKEVSKQLGNWQLFRIVIPGYMLTFNMRHGKFSGQKEGDFSLMAGADVIALQNRIKAMLPWN